jgi:DnaA-homolog protein
VDGPLGPWHGGHRPLRAPALKSPADFQLRQIPLALGLQAQPRLANFVAGPNAAALAHLEQLSWPGPPLYLWGAAGSGKTHLLQGLAHRVQDAGGASAWFDAQDPLPWELEPGVSLVLIDRCEALDPAHQQAAFALFEHALAESAQFAAAGRLPPVDLPLRDDLRTRLGWGHIFALQPLDDTQTRRALRAEAQRRGIELSDEVMGYLLVRFPRDLSSLMRMLDQMDEYALSQARAVTVPLVRRMLADEGAAS